MSSLDNLHIFLEKAKLPISEANAKMLRENVKAMKEAREAGRATITPIQEKIADKIKEKREQSEEIAMIEKEGDGGGGGGGLAGGGTVAVASDPGVFTSTYGSDAKQRLGMKPAPKKKKKKKDKYKTSGVTKLDRFLRGEKVNKSVSVQQFTAWLLDDVRKALRPENRDTTYGTGVNEPPTTETHRGKPRNPWGRGGKFRPLKGQQGYTMEFVKMETIAETLDTKGSVLDLIKALDKDVPIEVN